MTNDQYYFRNRADEELAAASNADNVHSEKAHRILAKLFLAKAADHQNSEQDFR